MTRARPTALALALLFLLASCGGDGGPKSATTTTRNGSPSSTTAGPATTTREGASTSPVSVPARQPVAHLVAVRAAHQPGSDRVVFEFTEQVPGYKVAYSPRPIVGTSGQEVAVAGGAVLVVRMEQASGADLGGDQASATYKGPARFKPTGASAVQELARVEDFEAVLTWAVGVAAEAPYKVSTLSGPPRLVIDVVAA
jgi:hypothetical protein